MRERIEIGLGLSPYELTNVVDRGRAAERSGFDYVFCGEHLFFHGPVPNAFVALSAVAGATERIKLLSGVTVLPLYPAVTVAKMASVLDVVSGGRFHLGMGMGGEYPPEFEAAGVPLGERGRRTDEALEVIRALFSSNRTSFAGSWTRFDDLGLSPMATQPGGPPIWVAGRSDAAKRRAGRFADVWMPYMYTPEQLAESLEAVAVHAADAGRDAGAITGAVYAFVCVDPDGDRARRVIIEAVGRNYKQDFSRLARYLVAGTPAECVSRLREYAAAGATSAQLQLGCAPEEEERVLDALIQGVLPELAVKGIS